MPCPPPVTIATRPSSFAIVSPPSTMHRHYSDDFSWVKLRRRLWHSVLESIEDQNVTRWLAERRRAVEWHVVSKIQMTKKLSLVGVTKTVQRTKEREPLTRRKGLCKGS